jgi:hypothetical protein
MVCSLTYDYNNDQPIVWAEGTTFSLGSDLVPQQYVVPQSMSKSARFTKVPTGYSGGQVTEQWTDEYYLNIGQGGSIMPSVYTFGLDAGGENIPTQYRVALSVTRIGNLIDGGVS